MPDPTTLRAGDRIADRYVVERVLGQGGMGIVVAARHVELQQLFAIKLLLPHATRDGANTERLLREARAAARLGSAHVARVSDVGRTASGEPYLVMEYLEGLDLEQLVEAKGPILAADAAFYVSQACDAVGEAHAAGIVHRDLKPANLFIARRADGSAIVKVLDFGIAKEDAALAAVSMTTTGAMLGSPVYMAPEQVRSAKLATPASDIWALGVTLYELVTARFPYQVNTVTELIAAILTERPIPPRARNPDVPEELEAIIMRCLERDPAARFRTAGELAAALAPLAGAARPWAALPSPVARASQAEPSLGELPTLAQTAAGTSTSVTRARSRNALPIGIALGVLLSVLTTVVVAIVLSRGGAPVVAPAASVAAPTAPQVEPRGPAREPALSAAPVEAPAAPVAAGSGTPAASASAPPRASSSSRATASSPPPRPRAPAKPPSKPPPAKTSWGGLL